MAGSLSKCCIVRIFPYRTQVVLSDLCRRLSRYLCSHAASSVLTGTLASKLKDHARLSARSAFRVQVLFDTDRLLQKAKSNDDVLSVTCMQISRLLDRSIVAYTKGENGMLSGRL